MPKKHIKYTAIARKAPSRPVRYLYKKGLLKGECLDYGCGRGYDAKMYGMSQYDRYWPSTNYYHLTKYDTITCTYVLCINGVDIDSTLSHIKRLLKPNGIAYISVVNNPSQSKLSNQTKVILDLPRQYQCKDFTIYRMDKNALNS